MRLSNTVLLTTVWAVAITSLMLLSAAIANAGTMTSDVILRDIWDGIDPDDNPWVRHGDITIVFDPASISIQDPNYPGIGIPERVRFEIATRNNFGIYAWDDSPIGWIDVQAQQWDLIVDGIGCECFGGGDDLDRLRDAFIADSIHLVNTSDEQYIERTFVSRSTDDIMTVRDSADSIGLEWRNTTVTIPEPSAVFLLVCGLMLCVGGRTR